MDGHWTIIPFSADQQQEGRQDVMFDTQERTWGATLAQLFRLNA